MWLAILSLFLSQGLVTQAVTLVAQVSVGGVKGMMTFSQTNAGDPVTVNTTLAGPNAADANTWQFHTFRLNYDVADRCSVTNLGPRILTSVSGSVTSGESSASGFDLSGNNTIEGRSLALLKTDGTIAACATVESSESYVTARATFRQRILGHITFRQQAASSSAMTRLTVDLYSDGSESSVQDLEWRVVEGEDCDFIRSPYNPTGASASCNGADMTLCAIGELKGKLGMIDVGVTMGTTRRTFADMNLPLSGANSVLGKTVQLFGSGQTPLACATIHAYSARVGIATFDNDGVTGTITLRQPSPLDPTTTEVQLNNLQAKAGGYHVHLYPVPQRLSKDTVALCSGASVSGHFNPFSVIYDASSPAAAASTEDMYEVGDLSKKYGMLDNATNKTATYTDYNLPLFGINSVLGRSIVIHYSTTGGPRWVCTNIQDTQAWISATATFTFPVIGHVLMQQRAGDPYSETAIYYRLDYGTGMSTATSGHSWAVHAMPVGDDMLEDNEDTRCVSAGEVFNPMTVNSTEYAAQCMPSNPLRCHLGDLKGKHGSVSVRGASMGSAIGFFTDVNLPLQGGQSVVGKAVVLKAADGGNKNLACATLVKVWPVVTEATEWGSTDYGSITFTQQTGVVHNPTRMDLNLNSLSPGDTISWRIGNKPAASGDDRCSALGLYNPFEVTTAGATKDKIAVGDLTAKFGALSGTESSVTKMDPSLDLWGPRGVTGRSMTLSRSGTTLGCSNIRPKMVEGGKFLRAEASFTGEIIGTIMLSQYLYPDGAMTPTTVVVNLLIANGSQTMHHDWHTHVHPIGNDSMASSGRCESAGGHYNPFKVNLANGYSECGEEHPLRCELGDQSKKLGTYDMGSGPMVGSDVFLPLSGPYGVVGRSMVVHTEERGAPRLACADILPVSNLFSFTMSIKTPPYFNTVDMANKIATVINTGAYNILVLIEDADSTCTLTRIHFLGVEGEENKQKFNEVIGGDASVLGVFQPDNNCFKTSGSGMTLASLLVVLASLFVGRFLQ